MQMVTLLLKGSSVWLRIGQNTCMLGYLDMMGVAWMIVERFPEYVVRILVMCNFLPIVIIRGWTAIVIILYVPFGKLMLYLFVVVRVLHAKVWLADLDWCYDGGMGELDGLRHVVGLLQVLLLGCVQVRCHIRNDGAFLWEMGRHFLGYICMLVGILRVCLGGGVASAVWAWLEYI